MLINKGRDSTLEPAYFSTRSESNALLSIDKRVTILEKKQVETNSQLKELSNKEEIQDEQINQLTQQLNSMTPISEDFINNLNFTETGGLYND